MPKDEEVDLAIEAWDGKIDELAAIFIDFLGRIKIAAPA